MNQEHIAALKELAEAQAADRVAEEHVNRLHAELAQTAMPFAQDIVARMSITQLSTLDVDDLVRFRLYPAAITRVVKAAEDRNAGTLARLRQAEEEAARHA